MESPGSSDSSLLRGQWSNPSDILSLLLLVGGDIIQKALAQFVRVRPFSFAPTLSLTPVAFSFGWVSYAFMSLMSVVGENQLMPDQPDCDSIVINCENAYSRKNHSWVLGRILRDHESRHPVDKATCSIRIDIFTVTEGSSSRPDIDKKW